METDAETLSPALGRTQWKGRKDVGARGVKGATRKPTESTDSQGATEID